MIKLDYTINPVHLLLYGAIIFLMVRFFACNHSNTSGGTKDTIVSVVYMKDASTHTIEEHNVTQQVFPSWLTDSLKDYLAAFHKEINPKDTNEVVRDYFTQRPFLDSMKDSNVVIKYSASIWKNSLYSPHLEYNLLRPTEIITRSIDNTPPPRNKVFVGAFVDYQTSLNFGFSANLLTKKERLISVDIDPFTKPFGYRLSLSTKLHF